jgi:hypothetical protein
MSAGSYTTPFVVVEGEEIHARPANRLGAEARPALHAGVGIMAILARAARRELPADALSRGTVERVGTAGIQSGSADRSAGCGDSTLTPGSRLP